VGLGVGALTAGFVADRIGRKPVLVGSVLIFGVLSIFCSFAQSAAMLIALRFLTGIGLGALIPTATTLIYEYAPERRRSFLVNTMMCGISIGASASGVIAALLIPLHGWRSVFVVGGVLPLALGTLLFALPESLRFMIARGRSVGRIRAVLHRIAPDMPLDNARFELPRNKETQGRTDFAIVLLPRYRTGTLLLWVTYFFGLMDYYFLTGWLPTLVHDTNFTVRQAALVSTMLTLGGVIGVIGVGWLMDRFEPHRVIVAFYVVSAIFLCLVGQQSLDIIGFPC
jgi:AAHS family 4-hydroxybenzoate transporter-like MFS transporter